MLKFLKWGIIVLIIIIAIVLIINCYVILSTKNQIIEKNIKIDCLYQRKRIYCK